MRRLRFLLPLVLIAALAVPAGASAHTMRLSNLVNKVDQLAQARVDESQGWGNYEPWNAYEFQERSCFVSRGNRHRHWGGCEVRFYRADQHPCEYEIRLAFRSPRSYQLRARYVDLQPEDFTCPARP